MKISMMKKCCNMQSKGNGNGLKQFDLKKAVVYLAFIAVFLIFAVTIGDKGFLIPANIMNIMKQTAMIAIMACAMTFVIATGEIDLSVGSTAALTSLIVALILRDTNNIVLAVLVGLAVGAGVGLINGLILTLTGQPSFLITMGIQIIVRGVAMWITDTAAVPITNSTYNNIFGGLKVGGIPIMIFWIIIFVIFTYILMNKCAFGKKVLAVGGNEVSARYSGIKTKQIKLKVMLMSGIFAAVAGMLYAGRMQTGRHTYADGEEMYVIAATVLGGTSMSGGSAYVIGTLVGALLMGMIDNGLVIAGFNVALQRIVRGIIIVLAIVIGAKRVSQK